MMFRSSPLFSYSLLKYIYIFFFSIRWTKQENVYLVERVSWYRDKRRINRYELSRMKMFTDHRFLLEHDSSKCRNQTCNSLRLLITKEFDYELRTRVSSYCEKMWCSVRMRLLMITILQETLSEFSLIVLLNSFLSRFFHEIIVFLSIILSACDVNNEICLFGFRSFKIV